MAGGGLMQLVAYGAQDVYLTGNPQITFFKVVYRRHTNFYTEAIEQTLNGTVGNGNRVSATVARNGDLVGRMYYQVEAGAIGNDACANPGTAMIDNVVLEIGGQQVDKHYGHWMEAWAELTEKNDSGKSATQGVGAANEAVGTPYQLTSMAGGVLGAATASDVAHFVPLQFSFCRNPGLALPLIALQYHEVKIITTFNGTTTGPTLTSAISLWADYHYLDTDERRRFAQVSHEYLIEQVQFQSFAAAQSMELNFNHQVKELVWAGQGGNRSATVSGSTPGPITAATSWKLVLNGHDRFAPRPLTYFTRAQVWAHHSGHGGMLPTTVHNITNDSVAVYSFALKPEEHQPSGTCNFSRIDNARLLQTSSTNNAAALNVYAVNYNVLRIMSGMGGLAYSN